MKTGWSFLNNTTTEAVLDERLSISRSFARCFRTSDGSKILNYLRKITKERVLASSASETEMRYLEGQRALVSHIEALTEQGRGSLLS